MSVEIGTKTMQGIANGDARRDHCSRAALRLTPVFGKSLFFTDAVQPASLSLQPAGGHGGRADQIARSRGNPGQVEKTGRYEAAGEEVYWRGFVQRYFSGKWGSTMAFLVTLILYTGVHLPTGNPVLILASFVCGAYWGALYCMSGSLVPVLISHMVWDPLIFIISPIR